MLNEDLQLQLNMREAFMGVWNYLFFANTVVNIHEKVDINIVEIIDKCVKWLKKSFNGFENYEYGENSRFAYSQSEKFYSTNQLI